MEGKSKLQLWVENFWYHHKWQTVFVLFILMVVMIGVSSMSSMTDYDAQILYTGPYLFTAEQKAEVESAFTQLLDKDYNEDGTKNCQLADLSIFTNDQLAQLLNQTEDVALAMKYGSFSEDARRQNFTQEITAGEHVICLLDPYWYEVIKERKGLVELEAVLGYAPENAIDTCGVRLKDTAFGQFFEAFDALPDDTILCMRVLSSSMILTGNKAAQQRYEHHQSILRDVFAFRLPQGFVPRPKETGAVTEAPKETAVVTEMPKETAADSK